LLIARGHGEADIRLRARRFHGIEHRPEGRDMLRGYAGNSRLRAPGDDLGKQRVVMDHIIPAPADLQQHALEGGTLVGSEFAGAAIDAPGQHLVIGRRTDRYQILVMRPFGGEEIDLVPGCA
tara:strand:- start:5251 stop:5616 length:366 start_codon:yes stop_codon:yes gene_type:complete